jgi:O-antigen/teichoic acid export membrane protein
MRIWNNIHKNKVIRNITQVFAGDIFAKIIALLSVLIMAKFLSVGEFGRYNYIFYLLSLVSIISEPFFNSYLRDFRYYKYPKFDMGIVLIPLLLLPLFLIGLKGVRSDVSIIAVILFSLYFIILSLLRIYLNVYESYKKYNFINILNQFGILVGILLVIFILKIYSAYYIILVAYSIGFVTVFVAGFCFIEKNKVEYKPCVKQQAANFWSSKYLVLYISIIPIINFVDLFFVEKYLNPVDVGFYSFALRIFAIGISAVGALITVLTIQKIDITRKGNSLNYIRVHWKKVFLFSLLFFIGMVVGSLILIYCFLPEYSPAIPSVMLLLLCASCSYMFIPFSFLQPLRKYREIFFLSIVALGVDIAINYFFTRSYGLIAASIATFSAHFIINGGNFWWSYVSLRKKEVVCP